MLADDRVDVVHLATPNHLHDGKVQAVNFNQRRVEAVLADLTTFMPLRQQPVGVGVQR